MPLAQFVMEDSGPSELSMKKCKIFYQRILLSSWVKDFTIRVKSAYVRLVIIGYGLRSQVWVEIFKLI